MDWTTHCSVAPCDPRVRWPSDHANCSTSGVEGIRKCVSWVGRRVVEFWVTDLLRKSHVLNATGVDGCPVTWLNISKACGKRQTLDRRWCLEGGEPPAAALPQVLHCSSLLFPHFTVFLIFIFQNVTLVRPSLRIFLNLVFYYGPCVGFLYFSRHCLQI